MIAGSFPIYRHISLPLYPYSRAIKQNIFFAFTIPLSLLLPCISLKGIPKTLSIAFVIACKEYAFLELLFLAHPLFSS
jgi:hypothetical protein